MKRSAGILCPMFSVPANQGIGDFGRKTFKMIDYIADARFSVWQILPLNMTGDSHSPFHTYSSFAGDPIYINLDCLCEMGLLTQSSIVNCNKFKDFVDYNTVREFKEMYFRRAFKAFKKNFDSFKDAYELFERKAFWLEDWSIYCLFKKINENAPWYKWSKEYRDYPINKEFNLGEYEDELFYVKFLQFIFYAQLDDIVMYAHAREITILSDITFVNYDSADVWANRREYLFDNGEKDGLKMIDDHGYSMPVCDFIYQRESGFKFWRSCIGWKHQTFDLVKVDCYTVFNVFKSALEKSSIITDKWIEEAMHELAEYIKHDYPDLELVVDGLEKLGNLEDYDISNVDVLLDCMSSKELKKPANQKSVLYTGTYNSPTLNQAYYDFDNNKRISLRRFFKKRNYNDRSFHDLMCRYALNTEANLVVLPIWDICGSKEEARINDPDNMERANWTWKLKDFKTFPSQLEKTKEWIENAGR